MKLKLTIISILIAIFANSALAGTVTITASGFATTSAGAPNGWPANVTWPGSQSPNGTKVYTVNDADWVALLTWTASNQYSNFTAASPATPTAGQILVAWVQIWVNATKGAVAQYFTTPSIVPSPITIQ